MDRSKLSLVIPAPYFSFKVADCLWLHSGYFISVFPLLLLSWNIKELLEELPAGWFLLIPRHNRRMRQWHPTPLLLPGKSHGGRSLVGCSPGRGSLRVRHDWATSLTLFTLFIGEGNGNPLQCCCLENPRDRGAWWAAVYEVAQSRTRLKRLSNSRHNRGFPGGASGTEPAQETQVWSLGGEDPLEGYPF